MDEITIAGIRAFGRHGAYAGEKDRRQPFDVALKLHVELAASSRSDRLADTVDYAEIHRRVVAIVQGPSFDLVERLGAEILDAVFEDERVRSADVSIGKPGLLDGATATVTLRRSRQHGDR